MPAAPEVGDGARPIGQVEVARELQAHGHRKANGHVGIAAEIEIELQRIGQQAEPGLHQGGMGGLVEDDRDDGCDLVGDQHLPAEADDEDAQARRHPPQRGAPRPDAVRDGGVAHDGARHQLREHGDVDRDLLEPGIGLHAPPVHVHQIGDGVEGEEGDAQRQLQMHHRQWMAQRPQEQIEILRQEGGVFEQDQPGEVESYRQAQGPQSPAIGATVDQQSKQIIAHHGDGEHRHIEQPAPGVEDQRKDEQHEILRARARGREIAQQECRQEIIKEGDGREDHDARGLSPS